MEQVRHKIELAFGRLGYRIFQNRVLFLVPMVVLLALLISGLPKLSIDTSTEGFLHKSDPARVSYNRFRDQFGRDEKMVVAVKVKDLFQRQTLEKLRDLHYELEQEVPYLKEITSLINARNTTGDADSLIVEDLFVNWPESEADLAQIKQRALSNPLLKNLVLNEAGTFTAMVLESNTYAEEEDSEADLMAGFDDAPVSRSDAPQAYLTDEENSRMVQAVEAIVAKYQSADFVIYTAGSPNVTDALKRSMTSDMAKFIGLVILTIIFFLAVLFRRASGVLLPLLVVILSVMSTMGLMSHAGAPIQTLTQIIPSLLLAVGVGASIHILTIFYRYYDQDDNNKADAIAHTLEHSGLAVMMTSLTTAAGLASFSFSSVAPVANLGIFASLGVLLIFLYTTVLLPLLLSLLPIKSKQQQAHEHHDLTQKFLLWVAHFSVHHRGKVILVSMIFMILTLFSASQLRYSHNPLNWFPEQHSVRVATEVIDREMQGSITVEMVIDTEKENGLYDLSVLKRLESLSAYAEQIKTDDYFVGKVVSLVDVIKEIHQALNENRPDFYRLPEDADLIAQEILLFENSGSDDLETLVDSGFSQARMTIKVPWVDAIAYLSLLQDLEDKSAELFAGKATVTITGMIPLLAQTITAAIFSSGVSYLLAFVVITVMMILMLGSFKLGLISMLPNLFPIFTVMAVMVVFNIPLDLFTMLIGSIVIGMAVDDTVHFMHNFKRYYDKSGDAEEAVRLTLVSTGRAMLVTSIVLSVGFFVYVFASMNNLIGFGILTSIAIIMALLADFFLAPALMAWLYRKK
ncbi:MAG: MMPL family transporter [Gammaproteobacteria bacterium]|nr:MMPL family transporter [Gammaproteobacteria bacterium]